jgi:hypothetical protein
MWITLFLCSTSHDLYTRYTHAKKTLYYQRFLGIENPYIPTGFRDFRGYPHNILRLCITCGKRAGLEKPFSTNNFSVCHHD